MKERGIYTTQLYLLKLWSGRKRFHKWRIAGMGLNGWYAMIDLYCEKHEVRRRYAIGMLRRTNRPKQCRECWREQIKKSA